MVLLRFLASVLLLIAVIAAVYDGTRTLGTSNRDLVVTSLGEHWARVAPASLKAAQTSVRRYTHPLVWDVLIAKLLVLPTWAVFGTLGVILGYAGRRRRRINVFAN